MEFVSWCLRSMSPSARCSPLMMRGQGRRDVAKGGGAALGQNLCILLYWILLATYIIVPFNLLQGDCLIIHVHSAKMKNYCYFEILFLMWKRLDLKFIYIVTNFNIFFLYKENVHFFSPSIMSMLPNALLLASVLNKYYLQCEKG